ncbi:conserved hypothetical protein, membrane, partial [mine drainage metagenome]
VFDLLAAAGIIAVTLSVSPSVRSLPYHEQFRRAGYFGIGLALLLALVAVAIRLNGPRIADFAGRAFGIVSKRLAHAVHEKILAFSHGLDAIAGWSELLLASFLFVFDVGFDRACLRRRRAFLYRS